MKNIILLTVDTLRYDYFEPIKKAADEVLGLGLECENAYATGPATPFSFLGILCSKYSIAPDESMSYSCHSRGKNLLGSLGSSQSRIPLAETLLESGYTTYLIPNNPYIEKSMYGSAQNIIDYTQNTSCKVQKLGKSLATPLSIMYPFIKYLWVKVGKNIVDLFGGRKNDTITAYYTSTESNTLLKNWLQDKRENLFIHINYMDVHGPYHQDISAFSDLGEEYRKQVNFVHANWDKSQPLSEKNTLMFKEMYFRSTFYLAQQIKELLLDLKQKGMLENSIIILTSDHGNLFGEYNLASHAYPLRTHNDAKNLLCKELLHVPLVFYGFGPGKIKKKVSLIDLAPTILDIVGIKPPAGWYGTSIFTEDKKPVVSEVRAIGYNITSIATEEAIFSYTEQSKSWLQPGKTEQEKDTEDLDKVLEEHKKQKDTAHAATEKVALRKKIAKLQTKKSTA